MNSIKIRGARTHNLKNISLDIPRNKLVVITGLSGSGKSSLAFDTLYAEGQRRYVESLSPYARQFLGLMDKADVDSIEGLSPAIAIEQKSSNRSARSTVGTSTEISDYLRLLFARTGIPRCPVHDIELTAYSIARMTDEILQLPEGCKIMILAPLIRKGEEIPNGLSDDLQVRGYTRVRIDGKVFSLPDWPDIKNDGSHSVQVVIDRLKVKSESKQRIAESLEAALRMSSGIAVVSLMDEDKELVFSDKFACPHCGYAVEELTPKLFSFNSPEGACKTCGGMGLKEDVDPELVVKDPKKSLADGAIESWDKSSPLNWEKLEKLSRDLNFDLDTAWEGLPQKVKEALLYGDGAAGKEPSFEGIIANARRQTVEGEGRHPVKFRQWIRLCACPECGGDRLVQAARYTFIGSGEERKNLPALAKLSLPELKKYFESLSLEGSKEKIGRVLIEEIVHRLEFLINVGLSYLTLDRRADSLSGGEAQRIRLAGQIGSKLSGVMYVLDEPSIGLHQVDNDKLIKTLKALRDNGNSLIVVEHDEDTIKAADWLIDLGPGAGESGGSVLAQGLPADVEKDPASLTGKYLSGQIKVVSVAPKKKPGKNWIELKGARGHNLKNVDVSIPEGLMTVVCGVSGSGKSSLINGTLHPIAAHALNGASQIPLPFDSIEGLEHFDKVINVDQTPIGKTPRSNPATFTGCFNTIRELFSQTPVAKERGYGPDRFSFNMKGGRCEACQGEGLVKVEMNMLPDMYVPCDVCHGSRYNRETLEVLYKGLNIAETLNLTITQAKKIFENIPVLKRKLEVMEEVGLGYITLGQSAVTLSGGEAQRIKLALELSKRSTGRTLFILDEPTTGLHFQDVKMLLGVLERLKTAGNTIVIIEHNLDVIKQADWLIEMGPEGGVNGGRIIAACPPEELKKVPGSQTGKYLE